MLPFGEGVWGRTGYLEAENSDKQVYNSLEQTRLKFIFAETEHPLLVGVCMDRSYDR